MENLKIILFSCNWGPHAAYQTLLDNNSNIPFEVSMIRIPCTGRLSKALIFRAFEMGADGVIIIGCAPGTCRYGTGTSTTKNHVEDTQNILELIGIGSKRLRMMTLLPEESDKLLDLLISFRDDIIKLGKSPVTPSETEVTKGMVTELITNLKKSHDIYSCQDCGKCSSSCPLTLAGKPFSPRAIARSVISGDINSFAMNQDVSSCLTCGLCYDRCPSDVNFPVFIRDIRQILSQIDMNRYAAHGGFFHSLMRTMTSPGLKGNHWESLPGDIKSDAKSEILFFGGCAPYFDAFFKNHLGVQTNNILIDSLRLLNFFDVFPRLFKDERCCGHDLLWSGDRENFLKLARLNTEAIENAGIKEVITSCPECYHTLKHDYPESGIKTNFKVTHIYDFLEKEIDKGAIGFKKFKHKLTFQDPCRLSRMENMADLPRKLIKRLTPYEFNEMQDYGLSSMCCGNCAWTGCDSYSKAMQIQRLKQARATGSDLLVTACPKCQIHLKCAMEDMNLKEDINMEMMDLTSVIAKTIRWE